MSHSEGSFDRYGPGKSSYQPNYDRLRWEPIEKPIEASKGTSNAAGCLHCARRRSGFTMLLFSGAVAFAFRFQIGAFLETMKSVGDFDHERTLIGFVAYAVTLIALLGAIKILTSRPG